ncbi:hypothetical protein [Alicyclobacillus macrosporangiidus]|uniref:hypothetical protein n=1 Tax=Alicyclobacillus macrosporangiidus TaxID=392015 RepID=UPI00049709AB|nr:hypothetical protein [Alicyclobacillus macrosporangiidus]MCL6599035.1 hypothetical protein [Alicyclobacillus macrosporangiidus]
MCATCKGAHRFLGQMVCCHSVYGWHRGVLTRVTRTGIVLANPVRLAASDSREAVDAEVGLDAPLHPDEDLAQVQFFGGLFVPFGGLYGLYPGFGLGFGFII